MDKRFSVLKHVIVDDKVVVVYGVDELVSKDEVVNDYLVRIGVNNYKFLNRAVEGKLITHSYIIL